MTNLPGTVDAVTVQLNGFSTKDQGDLLSLLVGPGGNNLDFFSLTGSNVSNAPSPFNLTFSDTASSLGTAGISLPPAPSSRRVTTRTLRIRNARPTQPVAPARQWDRRWPRIHSRRPTKLQPPGPPFWATRTRREFLAAPVPAPITETEPGVCTWTTAAPPEAARRATSLAAGASASPRICQS